MQHGIGSYELVMPCHVVWFEVVVGCDELEDDVVVRTAQVLQVLQSTTKYYAVLQSSTMYYSVLPNTKLRTTT